MTTLDMGKLTGPQRDALSQIACGQDAGHARVVLDALERKGLIVGRREALSGAPRVEVTRWEVPVAVHMQWAAWCAAQPEHQDEGQP